ncbi:hypothetical protein J2Y69_002150 [Microbacterium resistens]|uniref:Uncharacterized protein n=1 Tax=Microbacterium resistens TaxID=156977 RepID=A0ABU1SD63_9MICO|nr:hypothetical protein [Microbacterium resistens]MDR6867546.1 hypothetical protein [Microbacterium resistens]
MDLHAGSSAAGVLAVVALVDKGLAASIAEASPIVEVVFDSEERTGHTSAEVLGITVSAEVASRTQGRMLRLAATVVQTTIGGLSGGEGWGEQSQHVSRGVLTPDEARTIGALVSAGLLPVRASWREI